MKYQVGEKVKYDSGDWFFYGTVTAVIDNSICPSYRLNVDCMEKNNCRFSITQFEFELQADNDMDSFRNKNKWENSEIEYIKNISHIRQDNNKLSRLIPVPEQKSFPEPEEMQENKQIVKPQHIPEKPVPAEPVPEIPETEQPSQEYVETPIISTFEPPKLKRSEMWDKNLELYLKGNKSKNIYNWVSQNRRQHDTGTLPDDKLNKLKGINFPFEKNKTKPVQKAIVAQKDENNLSEAWWRHKFKQWEKGERESMQGWRQKCVKLYVNKKLSQDKIERLKKIGILK